ncbi:MAG: 2'-5' RNA ligase family protein [Bacteroidota bacterium]
MQIGFALLLNNEVFNFVRTLQLELHLELGVHLSRQPPHITIKSPFEASNITPFVAYLEKIAQTTSPFEITIDGFGNFGNQVLFLEVLENPTLTQLHHTIINDFQQAFMIAPDQYEGANVKFHVSIAGFNETELFQQAQEYISAHKAEFSLQINQLGIFYYLGPGQSWIINRKIRLLG